MLQQTNAAAYGEIAMQSKLLIFRNDQVNQLLRELPKRNEHNGERYKHYQVQNQNRRMLLQHFHSVLCEGVQRWNLFAEKTRERDDNLLNQDE